MNRSGSQLPSNGGKKLDQTRLSNTICHETQCSWHYCTLLSMSCCTGPFPGSRCWSLRDPYSCGKDGSNAHTVSNVHSPWLWDPPDQYQKCLLEQKIQGRRNHLYALTSRYLPHQWQIPSLSVIYSNLSMAYAKVVVTGTKNSQVSWWDCCECWSAR